MADASDYMAETETPADKEKKNMEIAFDLLSDLAQDKNLSLEVKLSFIDAAFQIIKIKRARYGF